MFQIKNFDSIVASMINNITSVNPNLTDFNVGSKVRTLLESVGHEIDTFYQVLLKGLYEAIEVAIYKTFSFTRLAASASSGYVTFTRASGTTGIITIPAGTQVKVPNSSIVYATSGRASLLEGSDTVDVTVVANATGASGNASANTITEIVSSISGIQSVNNSRSFINGRNEETDNERKNRFQRWIRSLARATRDSLAYGASLAEVVSESGIVVERVVEAVVYEPCVDDTPPGPPGYVNVYLWNGVDGASSELIANARALLYGYADESGTRVAGWKGAGVIANVYSVEIEAVDVTISVIPKTGYLLTDLESDIESIIDEVFAGLKIGDELVRAKIVDAVMGVTGVYDVNLTAPSANISSSGQKIIIQGTVTIN